MVVPGGNVGHKLLSLMGWAGGGLGKDGAGIAEPVTATTVFGREGLGSRQIKQNFKQKIHKIVQVGYFSKKILLLILLQMGKMSLTTYLVVIV